MNKFRKLLSALLAFALLLSMASCSKKPESGETTSGASVTTGSYHVSIQSQGGMALPGIGVYIYIGDNQSQMEQYGQTDENGQITFDLPMRDDYTIVLSGVSEGYAVEDSYHFTGNAALITLTSSLVTGETLSGAVLGVGDVMYDFSVTTPDGSTVTLSEMLAEKKMVLLNFWYTTCTWCLKEFPYMQEAYELYQDDVGIIAVDPLEQNAAIASFQAQNGLTFPMAECPAAWSAVFGISGYPTSVIIDRYGVICLIEAGGITSLRPFTSLFNHFTAEPYEQKLFGNLSELVSNVKPTYTMESSDAIGAVLDGDKLDVTYRPETEGESAEYSWPFVITEKDGIPCLKASNQEIEASYAILYADVYLEAGQAVGFDYLSSTEKACDILFVIVNDEDVYQISGASSPEEWKTCYPWVATEDGVHEIALCYLKDSDTNVGDDTVYLKNLHVINAADINVPTYIPRYPASTTDGITYTYETIVLNEKDGYYHVGSVDGPLLLADLMNYTQFNEEKTVWEIVYNGNATLNGKNFYEDMVDYFSYASNSSLSGVCTVNYELGEWLKLVAENVGFDNNENEWLKICKYYQIYGTDVHLADPIKGLANFSAYEAKLGKNISTNYFYYDRPIMPRGLLAKFVPAKSGVYRITSRSTSLNGVEAWIFGENRETDHYTYEPDQRIQTDGLNVSMLFYMEAGKPYYIDIAFWDIYEVGYIYYDIEYVAAEYNVFRLASPGYFTYDTNATGDQMYALIAGGIDVVLGEDGRYYQDLGMDANGNQKYGSLLYADFTGITGLFSQAIATVPAYDENGKILLDNNGDPILVKGMIDLGGFDFSKTENDLYILSILKKYNGDIDAADAYLKTLWGDEYDANAEEYQLEDVFAGKYHGRGEDYTAEMERYLDKMITSGPEERRGCVVVDERLAELLQLLVDKYTFSGVDHSWTKMCYYYDHLGPEN